jgi:hypothetical protein
MLHMLVGSETVTSQKVVDLISDEAIEFFN